MLILFPNINFKLLFCAHISPGVVAIAQQGLERDIRTRLWAFYEKRASTCKQNYGNLLLSLVFNQRNF